MEVKKTCGALAAALMLLLSACGGGQSGQSALPEPSTAPSAAVSAPLEDSPAPGSSGPAQPTPEELLAQQPIDDTHDAFLVDTGGELGTLLVTVELGERDPETWDLPLSFAVWNPEDMNRPVQEMEKWTMDVFQWHAELDANFDGFGDFSYTYAMGNQPSYGYLWIWDEEAAQFVEVPEYAQISCPRLNPETGIIDGFARYSGASDGLTTFYRWEDGELVCIRRIEVWWEPGEEFRTEEEITVFPMHIKVEDRIDGELTQVYAKVLPPEESYLAEREKWENLDYHGEE